MSRGDQSKWLEAHTDRGAKLTTMPRNAVLADVTGNGEYHLVISDLKIEESRSRLKVYKGTFLISDVVLRDLSNSIVSFYSDRVEPKLPVIAVACGSQIFFYKNLKPFHKFRLPYCPLVQEELELWRKIIEEKSVNADHVIKELSNIPYMALCASSQHILNLSSPTQVEEFLKENMDFLPLRENTITCMTTLTRGVNNSIVSCPVIGTEFGNIYILDPQNLTIIFQANTCITTATPQIITCAGNYDIDYRIYVATRENTVCVVKKNWLEGKIVIRLNSYIVDMVLIPGDNFLVVGTKDKTLACFTKKGQQLWSATTNDLITCLCLVPLDHLTAQLVAVGLKNGTVCLYQGRNVVDVTSVSDTPSVLVFGQLGQEENVLIVVTMEGTLTFKILKRTANFSTPIQEASSVLQEKPIPLPKRSKLFLEQSARERKHAVEIHQIYQQNLLRLRLSSACALVDNINNHQSSNANEKEDIKISAQVLGLGPKFTVILCLENISSEKPLYDLSVAYHANPLIYLISSHSIKIPFVPTSFTHKIKTDVFEISDKNENEKGILISGAKLIKVLVTRGNRSRPILAATINMPVAEFMV